MCCYISCMACKAWVVEVGGGVDHGLFYIKTPCKISMSSSNVAVIGESKTVMFCLWGVVEYMFYKYGVGCLVT